MANDTNPEKTTNATKIQSVEITVPRSAWKRLGLDHPPNSASQAEQRRYAQNLAIINRLIQNTIGVNLKQNPRRMEHIIWSDAVIMHNLWHNILSKHQITTAQNITCEIKTRVNPHNLPMLIRFSMRTPMSTNVLRLTIFRAVRKRNPQKSLHADTMEQSYPATPHHFTKY